RHSGVLARADNALLPVNSRAAWQEDDARLLHARLANCFDHAIGRSAAGTLNRVRAVQCAGTQAIAACLATLQMLGIAGISRAAQPPSPRAEIADAYGSCV
ncbi:hypothetical protein, partial [Xanthomonas phaseoli]|uniref:hypothetical protein n=1 Tax=Xanthomonas phaseoli TaxID=1985254 RepID=UPI001E537334